MIRLVWLWIQFVYWRLRNIWAEIVIEVKDRQIARLIAERDESRDELIRLGGARTIMKIDDDMDKAA